MLPYHREKPRTLACRVPGNGRWYLILVFVNSANTQCKTEIFLLFIVRCHDPPCSLVLIIRLSWHKLPLKNDHIQSTYCLKYLCSQLTNISSLLPPINLHNFSLYVYHFLEVTHFPDRLQSAETQCTITAEKYPGELGTCMCIVTYLHRYRLRNFCNDTLLFDFFLLVCYFWGILCLVFNKKNCKLKFIYAMKSWTKKMMKLYRSCMKYKDMSHFKYIHYKQCIWNVHKA